MGTTKHSAFTEYQNDFAKYVKALAHPARIAIIQLLISKNTCICGDIVDELELAQSTISQHLKELKKLDIIQGSVEGTAVCYCLNPIKLKEIQQLFNTFFDTAIQQMNCC